MAVNCPYGATLQDSTNCALIEDKEDDILQPFERPSDTSVLVPRNLFSANLQSKLDDCDGTTSCKYVGFDFQEDTGEIISNMKYDIDISQVGGSKGVFQKETTTFFYKFGVFSGGSTVEPASGVVNFSGPSLSSTTSLYFSYFDRKGISKSTLIQTQLVPGSSLKIYKPTTPTVYVEYIIVSSVSSVSSLIINVTYVGQHADITFVTGDNIDFLMPGPPSLTMMVAPPGYTYDSFGINGVPVGSTCDSMSGRPGTIGQYGYCIVPAISEPVGVSCLFRCYDGYVPDNYSDDTTFLCWTTRNCKKDVNIPSSSRTTGDILSCKIACDSQPTCKGFNFNPVLKQCTVYSAIIGKSYDASVISFTRHDFPTSEGKLIPDARDSVTYLGNTGSDCSKMIECNSNIAHVFDTPGVTSFSTTDIDTCGFCPIKTVNNVSYDYYVRDEVGRTTKYTDKATALAAVQYTDVPNPNNTTSSSLPVSLYKITPYVGTQTRYIFVTSSNQIIYVHGENNTLQFSFILEDGTIMEKPPTLDQFGIDNKITSIIGNGSTITVTTAMPHGLSSTSTVFLYGDDLPNSFLNPTIISGNITIIDNPQSTATVPKQSVSFTFMNPPRNTYSGSSNANKMFFSKVQDRGIPKWDKIPVDYVTNGFQFRTSGSKYLKRNTANTPRTFFNIRNGKPDKYSQDSADTVFIVERVQNGTQYSVYECPAFSQRNSDCYSGEKIRGHTWFLEREKCECPPTLNRPWGSLTCAAICNTGCPAGFTKLIADDEGCLNHKTNGFNMSRACRHTDVATVRTVNTQYDMIFEMIQGSGVYDFPENMILQSLTGQKYLLENKRLRKIKNSPMYYWVIKNSGTDKWNTLVIPSQEMIDDMPKGADVTVPQDTGPSDDNYFFDVDASRGNPTNSLNYQNLSQRAWLTQILACPTGSYSTEGIEPCTVCGEGSTSTDDHKACVCSDAMYSWNSTTNTCDLNVCTDNKYNLINGKEPCTECVSGSTVNPTHTACVCPVVANGTNTWQSGTNTCSLVCNQGYTAYSGRCIDNLPNSIAQAALNLEMQSIQFAVRPTSVAPPSAATNSDIQNALNLEMQRVMCVMYNLTSPAPTVVGITPSAQTSLKALQEELENQVNVQASGGPSISPVLASVQSQLDSMVVGASKYSVPCVAGSGYYSSTGFEPCSPCYTCSLTEYETTACAPSGSPTQNRACTACSSYTCPPVTNAGATKTCGSGSVSCSYDCTSSSHYRSSGSAAAPVCSSCYTCSSTEYETTACAPTGSPTQNRACSACSGLACPAISNTTAGTRSGCGSGSQGTCSYDCSSSFYRSSGTASNPVCSSCRTCSSTEYETTACAPSGSPTQNRACSACSGLACPEMANATGTRSGCGSGSQGTCSYVCNSTSYASAGTAAAPTTCTSCATCGANKYISTACTATAQTVCGNCTTSCPKIGQTVAACDGTQIANPTCGCPTGSTDSLLAYDSTKYTNVYGCKCNSGYYSSTWTPVIPAQGYNMRGIAPCSQCTTCTNMQYETAACTLYQNRVCTNYVTPTISGPASFNLNTSASGQANGQFYFAVTCTNTKVTSWSFRCSYTPRAPVTGVQSELVGTASADNSTYTISIPTVGEILDNGTQGGSVNIMVTATNPAGSATFNTYGYAYPYVITNWNFKMGPTTAFGMHLPYKTTSQKWGFVESGGTYGYYSVGTTKGYDLTYNYNTKQIVRSTDSSKFLTTIVNNPNWRPEWRTDGNGGITHQRWTYVFPDPLRTDTGYWQTEAYSGQYRLNGGGSGGGRFGMVLHPNGGNGDSQIMNIA